MNLISLLQIFNNKEALSFQFIRLIVLYIVIIQKIEFMEKPQENFIIEPANIFLRPGEQIIKFSIKNASIRSSRYQISVNDTDHFKVLVPRTFSLAPGISKVIKIQHISCAKCNSYGQVIQVIDMNGNRQVVNFQCMKQEIKQNKRIEINSQINLQKIKANEEKQLDICFRNVGSENLKLKVSYSMERQLSQKITFKILDQQMVVLRDALKKVRVVIKLLKEVDFEIEVNLEFTQENSKEKWQQTVKIRGNSLIRSQFIADHNLNRIDSINHELVNGTSVSGTIFLVNNYHKSCPFKLLELIEVVDYKSYCQRLQEISLKLDIKQGLISQRARQQINYTLTTSPSQNDKSFTYRYSQLSIKDQVNSYKLRNSNFFKKNLQVLVRVQFGEDNPSTFKLKAHVINPALKISKVSQQSLDMFQILNDSNIDVPFKFNNNLYFAAKTPKGKLKQGMNHLQIQWRKQASTNIKSKQMTDIFLKCAIKMEIPRNQLILYEPSMLQRPKTAMIRSGSISKQNIKDRTCYKAPSKAGQFGVKNVKQVNTHDYSPQPPKYSKGYVFQEEEFKFLQINQNERGNVITNSHKQKNIILFFPDKGYLHLESHYSYIFPYDKRSLKFQFSGRAFEVKSKEIQDKQPYKILNKQLVFCFTSSQKQYEVIKEIQIYNRSNQFIMMYCLSVDDDYFHSLELDNKILVPPKSNGIFKISFYPKAEIRLKQNKIIRMLQFLINNQKQSVLCEGDLLAADIETDQKKINFHNCRYSHEEMSKKITLSNKGLNKVYFQVLHSQHIKVTPKAAFLNEKAKQVLTVSFIPSKIPRQYMENIQINLKGSHVINIPFHTNTLQPEIECIESCINFREGYLNQTLISILTLVNKNAYSCCFNINTKDTQLKTLKTLTLIAGQTRRVEFQLFVNEVGEKIFKLPQNFIELVGYGSIKGPKEYRYIGKKTLLQLIPDNPFSNLVFSSFQQIKSYKIKNLSQDIQEIHLVLTPEYIQQQDQSVILSCEPTSAVLYPGQEKQFKLIFIRGDISNYKNQSKFFKYNLCVNLKQNRKYRKFDFIVEVPAARLQIQPKQVYFPLVATGNWSKNSFTISNLGYKQVLVAIKKPINIAFQLDIKTQKLTNRLTKLDNMMEVSLIYRSKKPISYSVKLQIEDNFGKKYQVKVYGTTSNSPLLNCQKSIGSSAKGFSSKQIRVSPGSTLSCCNLSTSSQEIENVRFINRWFSSIMPDFSKDNENYNVWLRIPRNFMQLLKYFRIQICSKEDTLDFMVEELKKCGFPLYTIKIGQLMDGNLDEWSMCLWFLLSKDFIHDDTLKWVNKVCGINIQTYQNAFNHQKKIFSQLLSKLFDSIFKGKVTELQKMIEYLEPSFPVLSKIQNKKQFMIAINIFYHKFAKVQRQKVIITNLQHVLNLQNKCKTKKCYWILGNSGFQTSMGPNCFNQKYVSEKKMLSFWTEGDDNAHIKLMDDLNIAVWNNTLHDPLKVYELQISRRAPNIHNICIECQNKCSQQWKLLFPCEVESQYFFQFSGGMEFKCKMPDLGVIKSGEIMEFRIIYSPNNLKQHTGVLKISNKYQEHVYNLKGKSLRSNYIEIQRFIRIPQGEKHQEVFSIVEDPQVCNEHTIYKISVLGQPCEQLKLTEAKTNKKQIIVQAVMQFSKVIQDREVVLQIFNEEMTFCKNIRLIISVIPRPVIVQARLKGVIDKVIVEKIPITNSLPIKQSCIVSLNKISKEEYDNFNRYHLQRQQADCQIQNSDSQFKLNQVGKIILKPKQKFNISLSYAPSTLMESCCQIRIKMEGTQNILVYNFLGAPQLPWTENPPIIIKCETEQEYTEAIKVPNRLKQRVVFDIETNLAFIAGPQQIVLNSRQMYIYHFKILPLHSGQFEGEIIFKNQKFYFVYPIKISVVNKKKIRKIRVQSKIRVTSTIQIELSNKSDRDINYSVFCKSEYLKVQPTFLLPANSEKALILNYTPLFMGTKTAELKLYHETTQQINYNLQMISEDQRQNAKYTCALGEKKKIKLPIKNPTSSIANIYEPKLPKQFSCSQHFPLAVPAYGVTYLQFLFTQYNLASAYSFSLEVATKQIGNFNFDLSFTNETVRHMPQSLVHYSQGESREAIKKETFIELLNYFDQILEFQIPNKKIQVNQFITLNVDNPLKFTLKPYEKRRIKCDIIIDETKNQPMQKIIKEPEEYCRQLLIESKEFKWIFPINVVKIFQAKNNLQIIGSSQQLAKVRISLKIVKGIKNWIISDLQNFKQNFNLSFISSKQVYLQTIFNKPYEYNGSIMFYDDDMTCAERYNLSIRIGEKKYEKIWIVANVGEKAKVQIRLKNGKGKFKVQIKNNKMKQFGVFPMEGEFKEKIDNVIYFQYSPVEYNGNKKAEVLINSEYGSFNFYLLGKFPPLK